MIKKTIEINNDLESFQSALLVQNASKFKSEIKIVIDEKIINAKSIMGVISLGITEGQKITVTAVGEDEYQAAIAIENFLRVV
jgi:phosphotransferase system HPr (HPr) family protein